MRYALIIILLTVSQVQATLYADWWLSFSNQTTGAALTTTIISNGTVGAHGGYGITGGSGFTIDDHGIDRRANMMVGFANQPAGQYQKVVKLDNTKNFVYMDLEIPDGAITILASWMKFEQTNNPSNHPYDILNMYKTAGGAMWTQFIDGNGANYGVRLETPPSNTSSIIQLSRNTWYWIACQFNCNSGLSSLWVYSTNGTLVGSKTLAGTSGGTINRLLIGNAEIGLSTGYTYLQDLCTFQTYTDVVPVPNDGLAVPADRQADWNNAGFTVPTVSTVYSNIPAGSSAAYVQAALNSCPSNQAVVLASGDYAWSTVIDFQGAGNGVVLRGTQSNGTNASRVTWSDTRGIRIWNVFNESKLGTDANVTQNIRKGDTEIKVASMPTWCVPGKILGIDMLNDAIAASTNTYAEVSDIYRKKSAAGSNGDRGQGELVYIVSTNSTTITVREPILHDFSTNRTAQIFMPAYDMAAYSMKTMCGIENIDLIGSGVASTDARTIFLIDCYRCWVTGCGSFTSRSVHFLSEFCYQNVLRGNYCYDASTYAAGQSYGITLYDLSTRCLIENNIVRRSRASYGVNYGCSGNVFGYNYALESHSDSNVGPEGHFHGNSADYNLFEGNVMDGKIDADAVHGSNSKGTMFRNALFGKVQTEVDGGNPGEQVCSTIDIWQRDFTIVGNVLGTSGWHTNRIAQAPASGTTDDRDIFRFGYENPWGKGASHYDTFAVAGIIDHANYDVVTAGIVNDGTMQTTTLSNSLYLTSSPSWWTITNATWPNISPTNVTSSRTVTNLPAGYRYVFNTAPGTPSGGSSSGATANVGTFNKR